MIIGLKLAKTIEVSHLLVWTDSQLVASQIGGDYQTKDVSLLKHLQQALQLAKELTKDLGLNRMVIQETLEALSTEVEDMMVLENAKGWMTPII